MVFTKCRDCGCERGELSHNLSGCSHSGTELSLMELDDIAVGFAKHAIELARQARIAGNQPFGALLVLDGNIVLRAQNTVATESGSHCSR